MPIHCLYDARTSSQKGEGEDSGSGSVDIVAVHDAHETSDVAWTNSTSRMNWLQVLPRDLSVGRIMLYSYHASPSDFFAPDSQAKIQMMAEVLVQELRGDRQVANAQRRPIIFICHGLGGILVKKSLIYSSTRTAPKVTHLWDQFISTFAILFFGTPHGKSDKAAWLDLEQHARGRRSMLRGNLNVLGSDSMDDTTHVSQSVDVEFAPLVKQFHLFFFWEGMPTSFGGRTQYIVRPESAVPSLDNTESSGIHAEHSGMVKFQTTEGSDYRTVVAALSTYCEKAPPIIAHRWEQADTTLRNMRVGELWELGGFGFDVHQQKPYRHETETTKEEAPVQRVQRHFFTPHNRASNFVGRRDLIEKISTAFSAENHTSGARAESNGNDKRPLVIFGMGGSGKTILCSRYAEEYKHLYAAVFTIHAASKQTITDSYCRIGQVAGMEATEMAGRHFLSQMSDRWLLIIDNADDPDIDIDGLLPPGDTADILITTRTRDFCNRKDLQSIEVRGLRENEALCLLLSSANIPSPWDHNTTEQGNLINKTLGYLALAVLQAGNCIFRGVCKLAEYLDLHKRNAARRSISDGPPGPAAPGLEATRNPIFGVIHATFDVSLEILLRSPPLQRRDSLDLLKILSFLHFENVPIELFSRAVENRSKAIARPSRPSYLERLVQGLIGRLEPPTLLPDFLKGTSGTLDRYRINSAISDLRTLSLIQSDGRYISLHPLIHEWAQVDLEPAERPIWSSIALNTVLESVSLPDGKSAPDAEFHRDILPHLLKLLPENETILSSLIPSVGRLQLQVAKVLQPTFMLLLRNHILKAAKCGYIFAERGMFNVASRHLEEVKEALLGTLGVHHEKTLTSMLGLAGVYWGSGRPDEAIRLQQTVVKTRTHLFGVMRKETIQARNHLGRSYWLHGHHIEALELQQAVAESLKEINDHKDELYQDKLAALDNLGITLGAWRKFEESRELHQRVLEARERILGKLHEDTLTTQANLAMALLDLGKHDEARKKIIHVHEERKKQLGPEHPWTLWALCYLAKVNTADGLLQEAEDLLLWGIEAGIRSLSPNHLGVLMGRGELARVYARQGRLDEAETLTKELTGVIEQNLGPEHPDCVYALLKLAQLYVLKEDRISAARTCKLALERVDMRLTREHPLGKELEHMFEILTDPYASAEMVSGLIPTVRRRPDAEGVDSKIPEEKQAPKTQRAKVWEDKPHQTPTW